MFEACFCPKTSIVVFSILIVRVVSIVTRAYECLGAKIKFPKGPSRPPCLRSSGEFLYHIVHRRRRTVCFQGYWCQCCQLFTLIKKPFIFALKCFFMLFLETIHGVVFSNKNRIQIAAVTYLPIHWIQYLQGNLSPCYWHLCNLYVVIYACTFSGVLLANST